MDIIKKITLLLIAAIVFASCGPTLAKRKEESGIHYRLGVVQLNDKNVTEALRELTKAVELYPDDPSYHNALGLAYFIRGMNDVAIGHLKDAIKLDPNFSESHVNLSAVYIVERRWDDAISESKEALRNIFYKTPELAHFNIAEAYYNKGEYRNSLDNYKKAVSLSPNYAEAYYNMGITLDKMNDVKNSIEAYEKAVRAQPGYIDAYYRLGLALNKGKDKSGAIKAFEKVIELAPGSDKAQSARDYINLLR